MTITTMLGACLWLAPTSGASTAPTATVVKQCAQGRAASYKLKPSDAAFLNTYLNCVLSADRLHAHPKDTIDVPGKSYVVTTPGGAAGGWANVPVSFAKYMAPTIAGFANAPESDENWNYIDLTIGAAYEKTEDGPIPGYFTVYGDTAPPDIPTLTQVATWIAPARATIDKPYTPGHQPPLVIDVVVQKGAWFHDGAGTNLRFMVLLKAV